MNRRISLFGFEIDALTMSETVERIFQWIRNDPHTCHVVVTPNVDHAVLYQHHAGLRQAYASAALVLADGMPVVAAARILGRSLPGRVPGSDLTPALFEQAAAQGGCRVYLLGAAEGVAERAASKIRARWPAVEVVGTYSPPLGFENDPQENQKKKSWTRLQPPDPMCSSSDWGHPSRSFGPMPIAARSRPAWCCAWRDDRLSGGRKTASSRVDATCRTRMAASGRQRAETPGKSIRSRCLDLSPPCVARVVEARGHQRGWRLTRTANKRYNHPPCCDLTASWRDFAVPSKNCLCIVVDRLHAGMIGAYGNSWIRTQQIDRLAARSFVFDQAFVQSPQLEPLYRSLWCGEHRPSPSARSMISVLRSAGLHTALVTDEEQVAGLPWTADFDDVVRVEHPAAEETTEEESQTQIARLLNTAARWLHSAPQPFCLWVHARRMSGAWDAPLALRNQYADEEDPTPPTLSSVPNRWLDEDFDPDEALGCTHAYAGQVALLDASVGALIGELEAGGQGAMTQVTLLSARGFPLGEHRRVGSTDEALYNELTQLAWLMHFPDRLGRLDRSQALVVPSDLPGTLLEWLEQDVALLGSGRISALPVIRGASDAIRDHIRMTSLDDRAIRTPAWLLRQPEDGPAELYAKPGDRWEVNEVANLCGEVVAGLQAALSQPDEPGEAGKGTALAPPLVTQLD